MNALVLLAGISDDQRPAHLAHLHPQQPHGNEQQPQQTAADHWGRPINSARS